jgi:hypothetical protein
MTSFLSTHEAKLHPDESLATLALLKYGHGDGSARWNQAEFIKLDGDTACATDGRLLGILKGVVPVADQHGKFPAVEAVFPTTPPAIVLRLDAKRRRRLLAAALEATSEYGDVFVEIRGAEEPIVVRAHEGTDAVQPKEFFGMLMPMTPGSGAPEWTLGIKAKKE